ncbi:MAG: NnrS family protein [Piscinibacter sp.]|uniref:NnrS family protein n=1 Tax=Piscinibacter TaxID=1114981 RepID=UPI000FDE4D46|nr:MULTISPECIES: NnrS family protein [Piscinibacter]MCW5667688.1 NnrS family protein [Piscinibacter sp.]
MKTIAIRPLPAPARPTPSAAAADGERWRWQRLFDAPHRLGFFAGALMLALSALWWAAVMLATHLLHWPVPWAVSRGLAHALWFAFGFMPLFFTGFLFTAGPKWLGLPPVDARVLAPALLASLAGWGVFLLGVHGAAALAAIGLAAVAWGWASFTWRFAGLVRRSVVPDRLHALVIAAACVAGVAALAIAALGLLLQREDLARAALQLGLWGFVGVVYVTVAHRMIPFFTASALPLVAAWRPTLLLGLFVVLFVLQVPLAWADLWWWPMPSAPAWARVVLEAAAALGLAALALRWGLVQSLAIRLLAMLHLGFVWLAVSFALAAASHALLLASHGQLGLGLAAQHALTMGFFGSLLLAMATRVACGHGGRTLAADDLAWALFWALQAATLLRVAAALWPAAEPALLAGAGLVWALAVVAWALRYGRWFGRPRADGKPG